ncbi:MAG: thiolase domain-containing protein [Elusimicrobia bacterium]|nr:thiolase domain-containing protein [Elusimicrobiota bacterium]
MRDVAVIGVGINKWGEHWKTSLRDLAVEAALKALEDAKVDAVDSIQIGCMSGGLFAGQEHLASLVADYLGCAGVPASRVESACASGGVAFKAAYAEVAAGLSDAALVLGVEKMTDVGGDEATYTLGTAADQEYECYNGATFPGLYAMMAVRHMHEFGTTRRQLSMVAVKNHDNGLKNPDAQYHAKLTPEEVERSSMVADPLHLLDCSPITDGAAALVLCPLDRAKKLSGHPLVKVLGVGHATDAIALHSRKNLVRLDAVEKAAARAYKAAGVKPSDIDLAEVHDCFTIAEIMVTEALGFAKPGEGGKLAASGATALGGKIPVNTSGGLKSKGHPVGATGVAQILELVQQLRGEAGGRQVRKAKVGLAQNMGGTGGSSTVSILGKA